ncbi:transposase [Chryseobacterium sp. HR92]|uniref:transposase n=1 Tax=Chryseobacterium sp. HR92 TaxID=3094839 RepID=UPI00388D79AA|nr:transposase [Chryseobacterium sp. HR92]
MNFKNINIGSIIHKRTLECEIEITRLCKFFSCTEKEITTMYQSKSLDSEIILKWSRILEYDFFRIYSQNLILYAPATTDIKNKKTKIISKMPHFRKNIYTQELVNFMLEMIENGEKTRAQIITDYNIPKTTLYKWIEKNKK